MRSKFTAANYRCSQTSGDPARFMSGFGSQIELQKSTMQTWIKTDLDDDHLAIRHDA
jgi:hypothetical protein